MFKIFKNKKKEDVKENLYHVTPISSNYKSDAKYTKLYKCATDLEEDYDTRNMYSDSHYVPLFMLEGPCVGSTVKAYRKDIEEAIKGLIELPKAYELAYEKFARQALIPPFYYDGKSYVKEEELDKLKGWLSEEVKPKVFSNSLGDKVFFFKLGEEYYESDTPSFWLFLYKHFGYLNESRLQEM